MLIIHQAENKRVHFLQLIIQSGFGIWPLLLDKGTNPHLVDVGRCFPSLQRLTKSLFFQLDFLYKLLIWHCFLSLALSSRLKFSILAVRFILQEHHADKASTARSSFIVKNHSCEQAYQHRRANLPMWYLYDILHKWICKIWDWVF